MEVRNGLVGYDALVFQTARHADTVAAAVDLTGINIRKDYLRHGK